MHRALLPGKSSTRDRRAHPQTSGFGLAIDEGNLVYSFPVDMRQSEGLTLVSQYYRLFAPS
jgi:hypothetical protein